MGFNSLTTLENAYKVIKNPKENRPNQRAKAQAAFRGSALNIQAWMSELVLGSDFYQNFDLRDQAKFFLFFNIDMIFAFADINKTCTNALPALQSGLVNTVCKDFDREEW